MQPTISVARGRSCGPWSAAWPEQASPWHVSVTSSSVRLTSCWQLETNREPVACGGLSSRATPSQLVLRSIEQEFDMLAVGELLGCKEGPPAFDAGRLLTRALPVEPLGVGHEASVRLLAGIHPNGAIHGQNAFKPDQPDR
jgi:hypothetical protein